MSRLAPVFFGVPGADRHQEALIILRGAGVNLSVGCDMPRGDYVTAWSAASRMDRRGPCFSFESCVDLLWKLDWEIARLLHATPHDIIDMKCFAFNAAVTAWQLADWVFEDMTIEQRQHVVYQNYPISKI
jgi:hypothetical protein